MGEAGNYFVQHFFGEASGKGVLLAGMVATNNDLAGRQLNFGTVSEFGEGLYFERLKQLCPGKTSEA